MPERYEREIEEIIGETGGFEPRRPLRQHFKEAQERAKESLNQEVGRWFRWITPTKVGGLGAICLVASPFVRSPALIAVSIGLLLAAYLLSVARGNRSIGEQTGHGKTWRGEMIDYRNTGEGQNRGGYFRRFFGKRE